MEFKDNKTNLSDIHQWIAVQPLSDADFVLFFQRNDKNSHSPYQPNPEHFTWDICTKCQTRIPSFVENIHQSLFSKLMGVLPISEPNNTNGYLLLFNFSGRPKYCFSTETASSDSNGNNEV